MERTCAPGEPRAPRAPLHTACQLISRHRRRYSEAVELCAALDDPTAAVERCTRLTFRRPEATLKPSTWRDSLRSRLLAQLGEPADPTEAAGDTDAQPSWAERAGRHGDEAYQFGDLTRAAVRGLSRLVGGEDAAPTSASGGTEPLGPPPPPVDRAGYVGKRSDHLGQWRVRWLSLLGPSLSWARSEGAAAHGRVHLCGASVRTDDLGVAQPFSLVVVGGVEGGRPRGDAELVLAAGSLRECDSWLAAIRRAIECADEVTDAGDADADADADEPHE